MWESVWNKKENKLILIRYDEMYKMDKSFLKIWMIDKNDGINLK